MKRFLLLLLAGALVLMACSGTTGTTSPTTTADPPDTSTSTSAATSTTAAEASTFESAPCEFTQPFGFDVNCGWLRVPEDRSDTGGNSIRLHVAVFAATGDDAATDPIVYLDGGPGGHTLDALQFSFNARFAPILENRPLVMFDQRGVGLSQPNLDCEEELELTIDLLDEDLDPSEYAARELAALTECRDRLEGEGTQLAAYNSAENAADVADLRVALGYDEINLWGISYGTRLALTVMRDHPEGIRSVVLDSTVPLEADLISGVAASAERAFEVFFASCAADERCGATYPDLEARFLEVVERLDAEPVEVEVDDFVSGETYPGILTGTSLYELLFQSLYAEDIIPLLPDFIVDAADGDYGGVSRLNSVFFSNAAFLSLGMYLSVQCQEEYAYSSPAAVDAAVAEHADVSALFATTASEFESCVMWGVGTAAPIEMEAVTSDIPTLVAAGEFDPITPPSYGRLVSDTLAASTFVEFPGLAHGVTTVAGCPRDVLLAFIDDPAAVPDTSCADSLAGPRFFVPGDLEVTLVPFEVDIFGLTISGVRPDEWDEQDMGVFVAPGLGDVGIVQQAIASGFAGIDLLVEQYGAQLGIEADWDATTYDDATGRSWNVYSASDGSLRYELGVYDDGTTTFLVLLLGTPSEHSTYVDSVFRPALDAITTNG